jgi:hypothetical protein
MLLDMVCSFAAMGMVIFPELTQADPPATQQKLAEAVVGIRGGREDQAALVHHHRANASMGEGQDATPVALGEVVDEVREVALGQAALDRLFAQGSLLPDVIGELPDSGCAC